MSALLLLAALQPGYSGPGPMFWLVVVVIVYIDLAKSFGQGVGFGLGLIFLNPIFAPILGFSDMRYRGPVGGY